MPGTPDPVLGSRLLTVAVAALLGAAVALAPVFLSFALRESRAGPTALAVAGGLAYALLCLGAWAGARLATDAFVSSMVADPLTLVGWLLGGLVVFGAQAGIPYYLYARWRLVVPLAALFGATVLVLFAFLGVRGESDPLALYVLFFGPMVVLGSSVLALAEFGVRRYVLGWM
ncbi:hypothetical protein [Halorussus litoreus]|uniref:hypothetical protein n=1 Tax=Halorussus litoreus TaxID=1710536 RepID=UPI000E254279|nr:hypothetical protein [Halorussus litoreus]